MGVTSDNIGGLHPERVEPVDFLIVGAQKGGTTAAAFNLGLHPDIFVFSGVTKFNQREIEYYNQHWDQGSDWYRSHFDYSLDCVGEKTAELLHRPICHSRMHQEAPSAKLLIFLRCPIDRAFSQWKMASRPGWGEVRSFEDAIADEYSALSKSEYRDRFDRCESVEIPSWREGYLLKGLYAHQLRSLRKYYPWKQIYVAVSELVRSNMEFEYNRIFNFLGVGEMELPFEERFRARQSGEMSSKMRRFLTAFYRDNIQDLKGILDVDLPWKNGAT